MNLSDFLTAEDQTVLEVMRIIDHNTKGVAFISKGQKLLGVVTDGDIRRYILRNGDLNAPIRELANYKPKYVTSHSTTDYSAYMRKYSITALPVVDEDKKILTIRFLYDNKPVLNANLKVPVVIMAGGKGTRLYPYTQILPKPLIPINDKTIAEIIMDHFEAFGCNKFDMIVNYKKNFIKSFFIDNEIKRNITFIEEADYCGTGGGLKLLEGKYNDAFFVTNCDILVEDDYSEMMKYHKEQKNIITIISATKNTTIPYGTIQMNTEGQVVKLVEKPSYSFLTNTGLYILEPRFLDLIPADTFIHITDLIQNCIDQGEKVGIYPVSENAWMDMGQMEELEKMRERLSGDAVK